MQQLKLLLHKLRYNTLMVLRGVFFVTGKIPFLLVMVLAGWYSFLVNDQGQDMMIAFGVDEANQGVGMYLFLFIAYLFVWSTVLWYVARIVLHSANLKKILDKRVNPESFTIQGSKLPSNVITAQLDLPYKDFIEWLARWVPRILSLFPYIIFLWGYISVSVMTPGNIAIIVIVIVLAIFHFIFLYKRKMLVRKTMERIEKKDMSQVMENRFPLDAEKDLRKIIRIHRLKIISILLLIAVLGAFAYSLSIARFATPGLAGKPGLIILSALIVYSFLGLFINYCSNILKFPLMSVLIVLAIVISLPRNNNHGLLTINSQASAQMAAQREPDSVFFRQWLNYRLADPSRYFNRNQVIPVFIVAAEGGGIRACYWTANVLKQIHIDFDSIYKNQSGGFYKNTFAVTGASGGSVGLGFFYNYIYQVLSRQGNFDFSSRKNYDQLDTIAGSDFLSSVTYGFAFPDLLQRMMPFKVPSWDRARFLGSSFSRTFQHHTIGSSEESLLDQPYLKIWSDPATMYQYPSLLFNSLYVEQGQKAIFSPFRLSDINYYDVLDIIDTIKLSPAINEGMVSSARFPIITPPGLMQKNISADPGKVRWKPIGHLVDGGYFENTAVQTAQQTAIMILRTAAKMPELKAMGLRVQPIIVSVVFGGPVHASANPLGSGYELAPATGALNTLFRWYDGARDITIQLDSSRSLTPTYFRLYNKRLMGSQKKDSSIFRLPLGWYLSNTSREVIRAQVSDVYYKSSRAALFRKIENGR